MIVLYIFWYPVNYRFYKPFSIGTLVLDIRYIRASTLV